MDQRKKVLPYHHKIFFLFLGIIAVIILTIFFSGFADHYEVIIASDSGHVIETIKVNGITDGGVNDTHFSYAIPPFENNTQTNAGFRPEIIKIFTNAGKGGQIYNITMIPVQVWNKRNIRYHSKSGVPDFRGER